MSSEFLSELDGFGAAAGQLVDLSDGDDPSITRYLDLLRVPVEKHQESAAFEVDGLPVAFLVDARTVDSPEFVARWIRRVSFRGDARWVGFLRHGRLDVYPAGLTEDPIESPEPIRELTPGALLLPSLAHEPSSPHVGAVRRKLFDLLRQSLQMLRTLGVSDDDAISLVGRGLFWRFLIDRHLLTGKQPTEVCEGASDWESCFSNKRSTLRTFDWLDRTFNGGFLPLSSGERIPAAAFTDVLSDIARGATPSPQLRLPSLWKEVDFAHIPVGLLSEIYEAWEHSSRPSSAAKASIHYTPRHLVELVVSESLESFVGVDQPKVLDPAAGAGVFLVASLRALVEREWRRSGKRPTRTIVRRILNEQLCGFDINGTALRLAELALYLTAIELDPDSRPNPLSLLRFTALRDQVLLERSEKAGSLSAVDERWRSKFDLVLGNPPWTSQTDGAAKEWVKDSSRIAQERLGTQRATALNFPDKTPDLPFVYRAMEWAKPGGTIALCLSSRWLFMRSERYQRARDDLFDALHVTAILNGSALRQTRVWPDVKQPWCVLFARNEPAPPHGSFQFISPQLEGSGEFTQDYLRIDWLDESPVAFSDLKRRPWLLKTRFRGTAVDESAVEHVLARSPVRLGSYLSSLKTALNDGYQLGGTCSATHLHDLPDLRSSRATAAELSFLLNTDSLPKFRHPTTYRPKNRDLFRAPLLLVREAVPADSFLPKAFVSEREVAFSESFWGASFADVPHGRTIARHLQLVLQSSYATWFALMTDSRTGVERDAAFKEDVLQLPIVPWAELSSDQQRRSKELSRRLEDGIDAALLREIDEFVFGLLGLYRAQRDAIYDTLATARPTKEARTRANQRTTSAERDAFRTACERAMNQVLVASDQKATIAWRANVSEVGWYLFDVERSSVQSARAASETRSAALPGWNKIAEQAGASIAVISIGKSRAVVAQVDRYRYWTSTRAALLAMTLFEGWSERG